MQYMRRFFSKENRRYFGFLTNGEVIKETARKTWNFIHENKEKIPLLDSNYHIYLSEVVGLFSL